MNQSKEKNSILKMTSYALGEVGCQASWYMINTYLMLFYTDVVGLSASAISMIMLIARVWDAINDPMMGTIADRTHTKWGKFRPYLFAAPPFLAIFNILTFTVFPVQGTAKIIICLLTYVGTGMAYTAVSIAYQSLQHVTALDSNVRQNLATARGIGGAVVGFILSAVAMPTILHFSSAVNAEGAPVADGHGYFMFTVILSICMIPIFWLCALGCKETYTEVLHKNDAAEKMGFFKALTEVVKNDQLLMVVLATVLGAMCVSGRMGILTYYLIYVNGDFTIIAKVFSVMTLAQFVGTVTLPIGLKIFGKKGYMIALNVVMMAGFLGLYFNPYCSTTYLLAISIVCGFTNAAAAICPGMVSDAIEYGDWKLGRRQEGVAASMLSFGVKISTAISGSVSVLLLAAVGYVAGAEQTDAAKQGINTVVNLIPFFMAFLSIVPLFFYKLNPQKVNEIRADLEAGKHKWDK